MSSEFFTGGADESTVTSTASVDSDPGANIVKKINNYSAGIFVVLFILIITGTIYLYKTEKLYKKEVGEGESVEKEGKSLTESGKLLISIGVPVCILSGIIYAISSQYK